MIYKSLLLVAAFALIFGVKTSNAQCGCIDDIALAVEAVMATDDCEDGWEAPHSLEVHLAKLVNWCNDGGVKPWKSKVPNIVEAMIGVIDEAIAGGSYIDSVTGLEVEVLPAPVCASEQLLSLRALLSPVVCP